jgi:hypothetical protein
MPRSEKFQIGVACGGSYCYDDTNKSEGTFRSSEKHFPEKWNSFCAARK